MDLSVSGNFAVGCHPPLRLSLQMAVNICPSF
jgi:hypothetical protein